MPLHAVQHLRLWGGSAVTHPDHFSQVDGVIAPQPWMQLRRVATTATPSVAKTYDPQGGKAKNEVYQTVSAEWVNNTPLTQWVYGLVHHGGSAVSLQARSRGYLQTNHGFAVGPAPKAPSLVEVSRFGGGVDMGMGGLLATGTDYAIHSVRSHSTSVPLMPQLTGWKAVQPGEKATATVEVRFISEFWENTQITGGKANTDCTVLAGELGLDLFAVPQIAAPPPRKIPTVFASVTGMEISKPVTVAKPAGVKVGDVLLAIVGNQWGQTGDMTPPDGTWKLFHSVNDGFWGLNGTHLRVFLKPVVANEPASYTFGNPFLAEGIVHLMVLRDTGPLTGDIDASGWQVASTRTRWAQTGQLHVAPSIGSNGQMLVCASFFGRTDNPLDLILGPAPATQTSPPGMTTSVDKNGVSSSMNVASLASPPSPTQARQFTATPLNPLQAGTRVYFSDHAISVSILIPGLQQI
jgi:hypothetical protein